jgi:hypothetical protein
MRICPAISELFFKRQQACHKIKAACFAFIDKRKNGIKSLPSG